jgi:phosphate transport system protein
LPRLMDLGLERLTDALLDMAELSEKSVATSIEAYENGKSVKQEIRGWSDELRKKEEDVSELGVEMIARYQPVATDLRFIKSCMEISYGFSRLGRYALDIAEVLEMVGNISNCDHSTVELTAKTTQEMIRMSIEAFSNKDVDLARNIGKMDDYVDDKYRSCVMSALSESNQEIKCVVSTTLIMRYLERIADHSAYIGDSVVYIVTGEKSPRK